MTRSAPGARRFAPVMMLWTAFAVGCASARPAVDEAIVSTQRVNWCGDNWVTTFTETDAVQRVEDSCLRRGPYTDRFQSTATQWEAVRLALVASDFLGLPERIWPLEDAQGRITIVGDDPMSCITYAKHRVCGESYALEHTPEGARFLAIWASLTAIAPEPKH